MRKLLYTCAFIGLAHVTLAQNQPFGIWEDQGAGAYRFVQLDAATGVKTNMNIIPGVTGFISGGAHTFNSHLNRYYFVGQVGAVRQFFTIDATNGNTLNNPQMNDVVVGIKYNCADSTLYGLRVNGSVYDVVTVNPVTAATTLVGNVPFVTAYTGSSFSIDYVNGLYSFIALEISGYKLKSVDLSTGLVIHDNVFPGNIVGHVYSCTDSSVFALWEDNSVYKMERINLATGVHNTVGTLTNVTPGYVTESSSVNHMGEYTYRGFDGNNDMALISVDLSTGTVIHNTVTTDDAVGFAEPGCCADTSGTSALPEINYAMPFGLYPLPAAYIVTVECDYLIKDILIYAPDGKIQQQITAVNQKRQSIDVNNFLNGVYVVSVATAAGYGYKKLVVLHQ